MIPDKPFISSLERLIETGSYQCKYDLDNLLKSLKQRIRAANRRLRTEAWSENLLNDLLETKIYLEEFKKLRNEL